MHRSILAFALAAQAAFLPAAAATGDRPARVLFVWQDNGGVADHHVVVGDKVPFEHLVTILFSEAPCTLQIDAASNMRRAWVAQAAYQVGCWAPTQDGGYVIVDGLGNVQSGTLLEQLPRAVLHADNSATITEPQYDSRTYLSDVMARHAEEIYSHLNEKP